MTARAEAQQFEQVIRQIEPHGKLLRTWTFRGGLSARMTALAVQLPDGRTRQLIVRRPGAPALARNPEAAVNEYRILEIVQAMGVRAPVPCWLDRSGTIFPEPFLVIEYIEGEPNYAPAGVTGFVRHMATELAKLHHIENRDGRLSFLPSQAERFTGQFRERPAVVDDSMDEERIRAVLEPVWPLPQKNPSVLVHGDFWPGNLLWRDGQLVAVIDWEDAEVGEPLVDLAISRLDMLWIFGEAAMYAFTDRYRTLNAIDDTLLPYWDLYAALRPMSRIGEWAAGWPSLGRPDITEATMRAGHRWFVAQAFAALQLPR